jgi:DNA-binding beta-propeller fold protein YncE
MTAMPMAKAGRTMRTERPRPVRAAAFLPLAAALAGCAGLGGASSPPPATRAAAPKLGSQKAAAIANAYTAGYNGLRRKFWDESTEGFQRAVSFNPTDDGAAYLAALSYTRAKNLPATLEWFHELWRLNSCLTPLPKTFGAFLDDPAFHDVLILLRTQVPKTHRSTAMFTLGARDLVPGDLAWDPSAKVFYLASLRKRRIVRVTPGAPGEKASFSDFSRAGDLDAVLGVKVDAARGRLWAVTATDPAMEGFRPGDFGRSQLVAFDLATGALAGRWSPMTRPPHQFGGLAVDDAGSVWVTDTASGEVHVLKPGAEELLPVAPKGTFVAPKSIAVSADGTRVYVADLARGVYRLNPRTGVADVLDQPPGPWPAGLDGLVLHRNALVGVAGTVSVGRVGRWTLENDGSSFSEIEILDCGHPAYRVPVGGTLVGDDYVYVANSQVDAVAEGGELPPAEALEDLVFLRLPLGR